MQITLLGNLAAPHSSENHHAKSLESLGHEVIKIQENATSSQRVYDLASQSDMFIWIHTHGWDVKTNGISMARVLDKLKEKKVPTVSYHLDVYMPLPDRWAQYKNSEYMNHLQYFFTPDRLMADWLNSNTKTKGYFLPAAIYDKEAVMLEPVQLENSPLRSFDVLFVGSKKYHPEHKWRVELINWLKKEYGRKFWHIGNDGIEVVRGMELNQLYANSKVVVGDSLNLDYKYPWYSSDRLFETLGRGGFLLYPDIKGINKMFTSGKHLRFYEYGNFKQLRYFIDHYLTNDEEREKIRKQGFELVKREHTYKNRWQEILKAVFNK